MGWMALRRDMLRKVMCQHRQMLHDGVQLTPHGNFHIDMPCNGYICLTAANSISDVCGV